MGKAVLLADRRRDRGGDEAAAGRERSRVRRRRSRIRPCRAKLSRMRSRSALVPAGVAAHAATACALRRGSAARIGRRPGQHRAGPADSSACSAGVGPAQPAGIGAVGRQDQPRVRRTGGTARDARRPAGQPRLGVVVARDLACRAGARDVAEDQPANRCSSAPMPPARRAPGIVVARSIQIQRRPACSGASRARRPRPGLRGRDVVEAVAEADDVTRAGRRRCRVEAVQRVLRPRRAAASGQPAARSGRTCPDAGPTRTASPALALPAASAGGQGRQPPRRRKREVERGACCGSLAPRPAAPAWSAPRCRDAGKAGSPGTAADHRPRTPTGAAPDRSGDPRRGEQPRGFVGSSRSAPRPRPARGRPRGTAARPAA